MKIPSFSNACKFWTIAAVVGVAAIATAQDAVVRATASDSATPAAVQAEEIRYEFYIHDYSANGFDYEMHIKLDNHTGQTWKFHASNARWTPVPERDDKSKPEAGNIARYELMPHLYLDSNGEEQEMYLRVDGVTGRSWTYRGTTGSWREIEQD